MNSIFLAIILLGSFSYNYSNIEKADALFEQGNQELIQYYNAHHNLDYSLFHKDDIQDYLDHIKEGLELLIHSGKIYFKECQKNYQVKLFNKLKRINNIIYRYVNLLKQKDKDEIIKNWDIVKKYIKK